MLYTLAVFAPLARRGDRRPRGQGDRGRAASCSVLGMVVAAICGPLAFFQLVGPEAPDGVHHHRHLDRCRKVPRHLGAALRHAVGGDGRDGVVRVDADPRLFDRLHGSRARPRYRFFAYLIAVHLRHVDAGDRPTTWLQLFFGWEGVGLCSYLLIGYWYDQPVRVRRGDQGVHRQPRRRLAFAVGSRADLLSSVRSSSPMIFAAIASTRRRPILFGTAGVEVIGFLLFIGAMGKSAQIPLCTSGCRTRWRARRRSPR